MAVIVDGEPLAEAQAREFWQRFSDYMEEHRGDLRGFAEKEGFASVHPRVGAQGAELVVSRTAPQGAYGNAPREGGPAKGKTGQGQGQGQGSQARNGGPGAGSRGKPGPGAQPSRRKQGGRRA